jgi:hypothetical protein
VPRERERARDQARGRGFRPQRSLRDQAAENFLNMSALLLDLEIGVSVRRVPNSRSNQLDPFRATVGPNLHSHTRRSFVEG